MRFTKRVKGSAEDELMERISSALLRPTSRARA